MDAALLTLKVVYETRLNVSMPICYQGQCYEIRYLQLLLKLLIHPRNPRYSHVALKRTDDEALSPRLRKHHSVFPFTVSFGSLAVYSRVRLRIWWIPLINFHPSFHPISFPRIPNYLHTKDHQNLLCHFYVMRGQINRQTAKISKTIGMCSVIDSKYFQPTFFRISSMHRLSILFSFIIHMYW